MISVVIPTLDAERHLGRTLAALVPAAVEGLVREVIVADGGSTDRTLAIADEAGADVVTSEPGRGCQLRTGACRARSPWLLFLHADTVLDGGWTDDARAFIEAVDRGRTPLSAAAFRLRFDDDGLAPRLVEALVGVRSIALRLPYGDQGLLVPRRLYDDIGGHAGMPLMEDVDIVRRLGRRRLRVLRSHATTSAERYKREGYLVRSLRNLGCLTLYFIGVRPAAIARVYGQRLPASPVEPASKHDGARLAARALKGSRE